MTTTKPVPSAMKMLARLTVAVLISVAPIKVRAASPESAELAQQAARLGARAVAEEDPEAAAITAFEAHNLWNRAFKADGDVLKVGLAARGRRVREPRHGGAGRRQPRGVGCRSGPGVYSHRVRVGAGDR